jgi:hypothetical protein
MSFMKKFTALFGFVFIVLAGTFFFIFYRMGANDAKAIAEFPVAYNNYDQAISDFSNAVLASNPESASNTDDLERKANEAVDLLNTKASVRISSLTKNDGDLMRVSLEIADLAGKELHTLKEYQMALASKGADLDQLAKQFRDLTNQRQAEFARYQELSGIKN